MLLVLVKRRLTAAYERWLICSAGVRVGVGVRACVCVGAGAFVRASEHSCLELRALIKAHLITYDLL